MEGYIDVFIDILEASSTKQFSPNFSSWGSRPSWKSDFSNAKLDSIKANAKPFPSSRTDCTENLIFERRWVELEGLTMVFYEQLDLIEQIPMNELGVISITGIVIEKLHSGQFGVDCGLRFATKSGKDIAIFKFPSIVIARLWYSAIYTARKRRQEEKEWNKLRDSAFVMLQFHPSAKYSAASIEASYNLQLRNAAGDEEKFRALYNSRLLLLEINIQDEAWSAPNIIEYTAVIEYPKRKDPNIGFNFDSHPFRRYLYVTSVDRDIKIHRIVGADSIQEGDMIAGVGHDNCSQWERMRLKVRLGSLRVRPGDCVQFKFKRSRLADEKYFRLSRSKKADVDGTADESEDFEVVAPGESTKADMLTKNTTAGSKSRFWKSTKSKFRFEHSPMQQPNQLNQLQQWLLPSSKPQISRSLAQVTTGVADSNTTAEMIPEDINPFHSPHPSSPASMSTTPALQIWRKPSSPEGSLSSTRMLGSWGEPSPSGSVSSTRVAGFWREPSSPQSVSSVRITGTWGETSSPEAVSSARTIGNWGGEPSPPRLLRVGASHERSAIDDGDIGNFGDLYNLADEFVGNSAEADHPAITRNIIVNCSEIAAQPDSFTVVNSTGSSTGSIKPNGRISSSKDFSALHANPDHPTVFNSVAESPTGGSRKSNGRNSSKDFSGVVAHPQHPIFVNSSVSPAGTIKHNRLNGNNHFSIVVTESDRPNVSQSPDRSPASPTGSSVAKAQHASEVFQAVVVDQSEGSHSTSFLTTNQNASAPERNISLHVDEQDWAKKWDAVLQDSGASNPASRSPKHHQLTEDNYDGPNFAGTPTAAASDKCSIFGPDQSRDRHGRSAYPREVEADDRFHADEDVGYVGSMWEDESSFLGMSSVWDEESTFFDSWPLSVDSRVFEDFFDNVLGYAHYFFDDGCQIYSVGSVSTEVRPSYSPRQQRARWAAASSDSDSESESESGSTYAATSAVTSEHLV